MDFSNSLFNLSKIEDSDNDTYRNSDCLSERFKVVFKIQIKTFCVSKCFRKYQKLEASSGRPKVI